MWGGCGGGDRKRRRSSGGWAEEKQDDEVKTDEGVLILTKGNYAKVLADNEYVLVDFYEPCWCHSEVFAPEYVKAAKMLKESGSAIKLGKVDVTEEAELSEEHSVRGDPMLKFYRNGKAINYTGGRAGDEIVSWLEKKTSPPRSISSRDEFKKFIEDNPVALVAFFKNNSSDAAKEYMKIADGVYDYPFAIVADSSVTSDNQVMSIEKVEEKVEESLEEGEIKEEECRGKCGNVNKAAPGKKQKHRYKNRAEKEKVFYCAVCHRQKVRSGQK